jgi:spindle assembly abnormal protein 6
VPHPRWRDWTRRVARPCARPFPHRRWIVRPQKALEPTAKLRSLLPAASTRRTSHHPLAPQADAYLLYTLDISEDEFHSLKTEQSLLVDFQTFPSKLVELLRQCQAAAADEHPRFVAVLSTGGGAGAGGSSLAGGIGGIGGKSGFGSAHHGGPLSPLAAPSHGGLAIGAPTLTITETNPFRQLCHLSLRFIAGNDHAIKT